MPEQVLTSVLEKVLTQALALNVNNNSALSAVNNKKLVIVLAELATPIALLVSDNNITVLTNSDESDCTIETSLSTLWLLKQNYSLTELIKQDKLLLNGDLKVAQLYVQLFENIDIDWQSEFAKRIGDIPSYQLSRLGKFVQKKFSFAKQQIQADAGEWLVYEKKLAVTSFELKDFYQQVSKTQQHLNQLDERIKQLSKAINTF